MLGTDQCVADWSSGKDGSMRNEGPNGGQIAAVSGLPWEESDTPKKPTSLDQLRRVLPAFMTVPEVAHRLRVSDKTVRRLVSRRQLPRCNHLGKVLIPYSAVEKWIVESTKN
jgi:excisionase family DNA binding protein